MHPPPFDRPGRFFRGNLHTHSTRSDGHAEPQEVVDAYRAAGYDFLVLTDHFEAEWGRTVTDTHPLPTEAFTTILGAEFSSADWHAQDVFWVVAAGLPPDFAAPAPGEPHDHAIRRAAKAGAFNILLHPGLTNLLAFDSLPVQHLDAVETFNLGLAMVWPDQAEGRYALDALLTRGCRLNITASDDAHWNNPWDRFGAWVEVRADSLTPEAGRVLLHPGSEDHRRPRRGRPGARCVHPGALGSAQRHARHARLDQSGMARRRKMIAVKPITTPHLPARVVSTESTIRHRTPRSL